MDSFFDIVVVPSSGKQCWKLDKNNRLKCYLKSPPEKNKANQEFVAFISKSLQIPQNNISISSGLTSRKKRIKITGTITFESLLERLGIQKQQPLFKL